MKFQEAFQDQLAEALVLTEEQIAKQADKVCAISGEAYEAGDTILFVMLPTPKVEGTDFAVVTAKKSVLEAQTWDYLALQTGSIPRVDPKTFLA